MPKPTPPSWKSSTGNKFFASRVPRLSPRLPRPPQAQGPCRGRFPAIPACPYARSDSDKVLATTGDRNRTTPFAGPHSAPFATIRPLESNDLSTLGPDRHPVPLLFSSARPTSANKSRLAINSQLLRDRCSSTLPPCRSSGCAAPAVLQHPAGDARNAASRNGNPYKSQMHTDQNAVPREK